MPDFSPPPAGPLLRELRAGYAAPLLQGASPTWHIPLQQRPQPKTYMGVPGPSEEIREFQKAAALALVSGPRPPGQEASPPPKAREWETHHSVHSCQPAWGHVHAGHQSQPDTWRSLAKERAAQLSRQATLHPSPNPHATVGPGGRRALPTTEHDQRCFPGEDPAPSQNFSPTRRNFSRPQRVLVPHVSRAQPILEPELGEETSLPSSPLLITMTEGLCRSRTLSKFAVPTDSRGDGLT